MTQQTRPTREVSLHSKPNIGGRYSPENVRVHGVQGGMEILVVTQVRWFLEFDFISAYGKHVLLVQLLKG